MPNAALEAQVQAWLLRIAHRLGCDRWALVAPNRCTCGAEERAVLALAERCARLGVEGEWFTVGGDPNVPVDTEAMVAEIVTRALAEEPT